MVSAHYLTLDNNLVCRNIWAGQDCDIQFWISHKLARQHMKKKGGIKTTLELKANEAKLALNQVIYTGLTAVPLMPRNVLCEVTVTMIF